ncbi:MAG: hypothetical protein IT172_12395 [Acidobacteria bacterium]|nr:hypothetical protein [Acidobacteriota bacterium]
MLSFSNTRRRAASAIIAASSLLAACGGGEHNSNVTVVASLAALPSVRLNYRYEPDVPGPTLPEAAAEERNAAVQTDFDEHRPHEQLDRTITSPDKKNVLAVYRNVTDLSSEYRLDIYSPDGKLLRKVTPDAMAAHFPDTIVWSPDSSSVAFVAMLRALTPLPAATPSPAASVPAGETADPNANAAPETTPAAAAPTPAAPANVLTFRTEQIYICNADGSGLKPLTQNDGLIYFYYVWSPDSAMLAALALTAREWRYLEVLADQKGAMMIPVGRPRVIEKNGRERRLDDNLSAVHPVWSPDSSKVAEAFDTQVRIYDATGTNPTQAAIPLKNQLLLSSQAYDRQQQRMAANGAENTNSVDAETQPQATLPDEKLLVSYNPIVEIAWPNDDLIYLKTAYLKRMKNEAENVTSFVRWHRLVLSAQAETPVR